MIRIKNTHLSHKTSPQTNGKTAVSLADNTLLSCPASSIIYNQN